ncbi:hypothetical protein KQX54_021575 [Cotesia glomerata]|uniref:Uncharacterized protein n=1 Tax=Cotesia glomerata TaxID=32391 RepID=A0AAV7IVJ0_COTGL|nr:hypothetical protein KQX54_021575 [Cotesia glomerata]
MSTNSNSSRSSISPFFNPEQVCRRTKQQFFNCSFSMYFNKIGLIYSVVMLFFARRQLELNDGMDIHPLEPVRRYLNKDRLNGNLLIPISSSYNSLGLSASDNRNRRVVQSTAKIIRTFRRLLPSHYEIYCSAFSAFPDRYILFRRVYCTFCSLFAQLFRSLVCNLEKFPVLICLYTKHVSSNSRSSLNPGRFATDSWTGLPENLTFAECTVPKQSHRTGICVFVIDRTLSFQSERTPDQICCGDPLYVLWTLINKFLKPIVDIDKRHRVSESGFRIGEKTIKIKPVSSIEYYKYSTHRILN